MQFLNAQIYQKFGGLTLNIQEVIKKVLIIFQVIKIPFFVKLYHITIKNQNIIEICLSFINLRAIMK